MKFLYSLRSTKENACQSVIDRDVMRTSSIADRLIATGRNIKLNQFDFVASDKKRLSF